MLHIFPAVKAGSGEGRATFRRGLTSKFDRLVMVWEKRAREGVLDNRIAVLPGTAFGMAEGCYLRIAYGALDRDSAGEGVGRLVKGLRAIVGAPPPPRT